MENKNWYLFFCEVTACFFLNGALGYSCNFTMNMPHAQIALGSFRPEIRRGSGTDLRQD